MFWSCRLSGILILESERPWGIEVFSCSVYRSHHKEELGILLKAAAVQQRGIFSNSRKHLWFSFLSLFSTEAAELALLFRHEAEMAPPEWCIEQKSSYLRLNRLLWRGEIKKTQRGRKQHAQNMVQFKAITSTSAFSPNPSLSSSTFITYVLYLAKLLTCKMLKLKSCRIWKWDWIGF